jgi:uncharacterized protein involved in exopolysaccharide biosynthesis
MSVPASPKVVRLFIRVLRARIWIAAAFLILAAVGIFGACASRMIPRSIV